MKLVFKIVAIALVQSITYALNGQEIQKSVIASASTTLGIATISLNGTVGEPIVGLVEDESSISQGFWGGGLIVQVLSNQTFFEDVMIYPNPVDFDLNLFTGDNKIVGITLFSMNGQKVLTRVLEKSEVLHTVDLSHMAVGAYVLQIHGQDTNEVKKFKIIKR